MKNNIAMVPVFVLLFAFLFLCGCEKASPAIVQQGPKPQNSEFVVGVENGYFPYTYAAGETDEIIGYDVDLLREVAERNRWRFRIQVIDWGRKDEWLASGRIDCLASGIKMETRENLYSWTTPYLVGTDVVVTRISSGIDCFAKLRGRKCGIQSTTPAFQRIMRGDLQEFGEGVTLIAYDNFSELNARFAKGEMDALVTNIRVAKILVRDNKDMFILNQPLSLNTDGFAFRLDSRALRDQVQETLCKMVDDGTVARITSRWFGENISILKPSGLK